MSVISTPITDLFGIKHPILLAGVPNISLSLRVPCQRRDANYFFATGMNVAAGPELAAAVTNAGGLGDWGRWLHAQGSAVTGRVLFLLLLPTDVLISYTRA